MVMMHWFLLMGLLVEIRAGRPSTEELVYTRQATVGGATSKTFFPMLDNSILRLLPGKAGLSNIWTLCKQWRSWWTTTCNIWRYTSHLLLRQWKRYIRIIVTVVSWNHKNAGPWLAVGAACAGVMELQEMELDEFEHTFRAEKLRWFAVTSSFEAWMDAKLTLADECSELEIPCPVKENGPLVWPDFCWAIELARSPRSKKSLGLERRFSGCPSFTLSLIALFDDAETLIPRSPCFRSIFTN